MRCHIYLIPHHKWPFKIIEMSRSDFTWGWQLQEKWESRTNTSTCLCWTCEDVLLYSRRSSHCPHKHTHTGFFSGSVVSTLFLTLGGSLDYRDTERVRERGLVLNFSWVLWICNVYVSQKWSEGKRWCRDHK